MPMDSADVKEIRKIKEELQRFIIFIGGEMVIQGSDMDGLCERLFLRGIRRIDP